MSNSKRLSDKEIDKLILRLRGEVDTTRILNEVNRTFNSSFNDKLKLYVANLDELMNLGFKDDSKSCATYVSRLGEFLIGVPSQIYVPAQFLQTFLADPKQKHNVYTAFKHEMIHEILDKKDRWMDALLRNLRKRKSDLIASSYDIDSKYAISEGIAYSLSGPLLSENSNGVPNEYKTIQGKVSNLAKDIGWDQVYRLYVGSAPSVLTNALSKY